MTIEPAKRQDLAAIQDLLAAVDLPGEDVARHLPHFLVARLDGRVVGTIGLEVMPPAGMLRSLAVDPSARGKGLGDTLYKALLDQARRLGLRDLYLLTTTAADYFAARGWSILDRDKAPATVHNTRQFQGLCPDTATLMKLDSLA